MIDYRFVRISIGKRYIDKLGRKILITKKQRLTVTYHEMPRNQMWYTFKSKSQFLIYQFVYGSSYHADLVKLTTPVDKEEGIYQAQHSKHGFRPLVHP